MSFASLTKSFPWTRYSKKLIEKIEKPRSCGFFTKHESEKRMMRLVEISEGSINDGNQIKLYWLVDEDDGIIVDAKFQVFGQSALIGALEVISELVVGKNYDQTRRINLDLIDKQVQDKPGGMGFPLETHPYLHMVLLAVEAAAEKCNGLPLPQTYTSIQAPKTPVPEGGGIPDWEMLPHEEKLRVIEEVLDQDVRPYIALDAGGVDVLKLSNNEVLIAYQGSCTSCYSAIGSTLSYIQQILKTKVHANLVVVPDLDQLQL